MAVYMNAKCSQSDTRLAAKPEERAECHVGLFKFDPDDAAAGPMLQPHIDGHGSSFCVGATCLQLDVTNLAIAANHDVVAAGIDFGPQQLNISVPATP